MEDRRRFLYPSGSDGVTEKASATGGRKSRGKRDSRDAVKCASQKAKACRIRKAAASTEKLWDVFQEKLLAYRDGPVPKMDTHGQGEDPEVSERTIAKELCKMTP